MCNEEHLITCRSSKSCSLTLWYAPLRSGKAVLGVCSICRPSRYSTPMQHFPMNLLQLNMSSVPLLKNPNKSPKRLLSVQYIQYIQSPWIIATEFQDQKRILVLEFQTFPGPHACSSSSARPSYSFYLIF